MCRYGGKLLTFGFAPEHLAQARYEHADLPKPELIWHIWLSRVLATPHFRLPAKTRVSWFNRQIMLLWGVDLVSSRGRHLDLVSPKPVEGLSNIE